MLRAMCRARGPRLFLSIAPLLLGACDMRPAPVELDSVADAPAHHDAKRLKFHGTPRPDLIGVHSWRNSTSIARGGPGSGSGSELFMFAMPVVPEGWTEADPVPLWLTASSKASRGGDPAPWIAESTEALGGDAPVVGKVRDYADREPGFRTTSGWQKAIDVAETEHGITSDPQAPVVMWPDPKG